MKKAENGLLKELKEEQKSYKLMLDTLVKERIRITDRNKFTIEEIKYWSNFFKIPMRSFLFEVLQIDTKTYQNFVYQKTDKISSFKFDTEKSKFLHKKSKKYFSNRNLNKKSYFNRNRILEESNRMKINANDFVLGILCKKKYSLRKVIKDETAKSKVSIGSYVNTKLPEGFVEHNYETMNKITSIAISRACGLLGTKLKDEDFNDVKQDCLMYIFQNGNPLTRFNKPIIKGISMNKKQKNHMKSQEFYYALNLVKPYCCKEYAFNDALSHNNLNYYQEEYIETNNEEDDVYMCIDATFEDKMVRKIFRYLYEEGGTQSAKQNMMKEFNLTESELDSIIKENVVKLQ